MKKSKLNSSLNGENNLVNGAVANETGFDDDEVCEKKIPSRMMKLERENGLKRRNSSAKFMGTSIFDQIRKREITGTAIRKPDIFAQNKERGMIYQRDLKAHTGCVNAVDFSPGEEWIVSGGDDLKVRLWKAVDCIASEQPASTSVTMRSIHHSNIFALRFSHKAERIYSAGNDHRLLVHDIRTREKLRTYRASSSIYHIATHPGDDNVIAASSDDRNVYLFDLRGNEGDGLCTKLRQDGCAYSVCWNPQNHHFVAVCNEKTGLLVYDLRMDNHPYVEAGSITKKAICADWSPAGDAIFCVISRSNPICFNLNTSQHIQLHDPNYSNFCTIKSCTFATNDYMLTGSDDWNIYVWKMPTEWPETDMSEVDEAYTVLKGHRSIVNHVKFGERSNVLISCGVEKIVKCWCPVPLNDSYGSPKERKRFTNTRLFPYIEVLNSFREDSQESDKEEDLPTLHRFDYYYENLRERHLQTGPNALDTDDSMDSDENMELFFGRGEQDDSDEDYEESFFSEVSSSSPANVLSSTPTPPPHSSAINAASIQQAGNGHDDDAQMDVPVEGQHLEEEDEERTRRHE